MRVLHVIPAVAARYGGPSTAVVSMSRALRARGLDTLIAATDADGAGARLPVPLAEPTAYREEPTIFFRRQWGEALKLSLPFASWLGDNVAAFDVVHIHAVFSHACLAAGRAARRHRVPYVVRPLGTLDPWSLAQNALRKKVFWALGARSLLEKAATVHYTSRQERRLVEGSLGLSRGVVIPLAVDEELFSEAKPEATDPYVLFLGRLHPKKNLETLIRAFGVARRIRPDLGRARLVLAGGGEADYVSRLRQEVATLGLAADVSFGGWVSGRRKLELLGGASLFVLPSSQENFGLSVAEAMARGVPVVVSPETSMADDVSEADAGWVVPARVEELASAIGGALADPGERSRRGARALELARERFRWPRVAEELQGLYETLIGGAEAA